jgi:hypothetical protein
MLYDAVLTPTSADWRHLFGDPEPALRLLSLVCNQLHYDAPTGAT